MTASYAPPEFPVGHDPGADLSFLDPRPPRPPLLPRLLRLRHLQLSWWQRAMFGDAPLALGILLALADLATAWTIVVLPAAVLTMVKLNDLVAAALERTPGHAIPAGPDGAGAGAEA